MKDSDFPSTTCPAWRHQAMAKRSWLDHVVFCYGGERCPEPTKRRDRDKGRWCERTLIAWLQSYFGSIKEPENFKAIVQFLSRVLIQLRCERGDEIGPKESDKGPL
jgi:hypothetical protein